MTEIEIIQDDFRCSHLDNEREKCCKECGEDWSTQHNNGLCESCFHDLPLCAGCNEHTDELFCGLPCCEQCRSEVGYCEHCNTLSLIDDWTTEATIDESKVIVCPCCKHKTLIP